MGAGLAAGYSGVAVFLAQLAALTGGDRYAGLAMSAAVPLPRLVEHLAGRPEPAAAVGPGAFHGLGGICYALARLSRLLGDADLAACLAASVDLTASVDITAAVDVTVSVDLTASAERAAGVDLGALPSGDAARLSRYAGLDTGVAGGLAAMIAVSAASGCRRPRCWRAGSPSTCSAGAAPNPRHPGSPAAGPASAGRCSGMPRTAAGASPRAAPSWAGGKPAGEHAAQQLLHHERHAGAAPPELGDGWLEHIVRLDAETHRHQLAHLGPPEPAELQVAAGIALGCGPDQVERPARIGARGDQQHRPLPGEVVGQVLHHGQSFRVAVVQVLDHHEAAGVSTDPGHQPQHGLGQYHQ